MEFRARPKKTIRLSTRNNREELLRRGWTMKGAWAQKSFGPYTLVLSGSRPDGDGELIVLSFHPSGAPRLSADAPAGAPAMPKARRTGVVRSESTPGLSKPSAPAAHGLDAASEAAEGVTVLEHSDGNPSSDQTRVGAKSGRHLRKQIGDSWGYRATWTRPQFSGATVAMAYDYARKFAAARYAGCYLEAHGSLPLGTHTVLRDGASHGQPCHIVLAPPTQGDGVELTFGDAEAADLTLAKFGYKPAPKLRQQASRATRPLGPNSPTDSTRHLAVVVHEEAASSTNPRCAIVATTTKAGRYDIYARELQPTETGGPRRWTTSEVWPDLRGPAALSLALNHAATHLRVELDWGHVAKQVAALDWVTAAGLANAHGLPWPRARGSDAAVNLAELSVTQVELLLTDVTDWAQDDIPAVIERLGQMAGKKPAGKRWKALERRLFGNPKRLLDKSVENGLGLDASLMDGLGVDIFKLAGLYCSDELHDALWADRSWQDIIEECPSADCLEIGEQDDRPGMSDVFYWVAIDDADQFARELRAFIVESAQTNRRRTLPKKKRPPSGRLA